MLNIVESLGYTNNKMPLKTGNVNKNYQFDSDMQEIQKTLQRCEAF